MPEILKNEDVKILQQGSIDLLVESYSNSARVLQIRGMGKEQAISADIVTSSDRSLVSSVIDITDTPIFLTARTSATGVKRGELYVKVFLRVDGVIVALLMAGYVYDTSKIAYPGGQLEGSTEGPGLIRSITGTDPAAGVEISETVPTGTKWKFKSLLVVFTTDATVISRYPAIIINDGSKDIIRIATTTGQAAGNAFRYTFSDTGSSNTAVASGINIILTKDLILPAGYIIKTITTSIVAGDNYEAPQLLVEEWIEP